MYSLKILHFNIFPSMSYIKSIEEEIFYIKTPHGFTDMYSLPFD